MLITIIVFTFIIILIALTTIQKIAYKKNGIISDDNLNEENSQKILNNQKEINKKLDEINSKLDNLNK